MKKDYTVGLMSGTSLDGVDAICVDDKLSQVAVHHMPYPESLRAALRDLIAQPTGSLLTLGTLDHQLGLCYARAVQALLKKSKLNYRHIAAIGNHGQTVFHHPQASPPFTLQLGDPTILAAKTGIPVVHDFRRMDMALGGQGAPLAPLFHQAVFAKTGVNRAIVNIGGMANVSLLAGKKLVAGFDSGPGNALLDAWIFMQKQLPYDKNGAWAKAGKVNSTLLNALLKEQYFHQAPPKSTGKELFHLAWLQNHLTKKIAPEDVQATLVELTAQTIVHAFTLAQFKPHEIYVCGGGAFNNYLMTRLPALAKVPVQSTHKLGVEPEWVEAALIAWLTAKHMKKEPVDLRHITGSQKTFIPGCFVPA